MLFRTKKGEEAKMVSKRSVYDNLSGLTLGYKRRNPLI